MRCLGDERISDSRRGYFALGCCYRAYGGLMSCLGDYFIFHSNRMIYDTVPTCINRQRS
nr:MAG TPA_asm: hypothetical protein [Caudoviricetes sp.]DAL79907.1 MAG TPA: hypothetical protein [Caudoviricetes sp.]DAR38645.1 MAG TPA: hypothetical protein [Caudoviricetes sp.]